MGVKVVIKKGRFELQYPYSKDWRFGYLVINKEPRRNVILFNSEKDRSTVSYARYTYEVSIGRYLDKDLVVDHIDNDKMNDVIENYQLISNAENISKGVAFHNKSRLMVELVCGSCGCNFVKPKNNTHLIIKTNKSTYCSRSCAGMKLGDSEVLREFRINDIDL